MFYLTSSLNKAAYEEPAARKILRISVEFKRLEFSSMIIAKMICRKTYLILYLYSTVTVLSAYEPIFIGLENNVKLSTSENRHIKEVSIGKNDIKSAILMYQTKKIEEPVENENLNLYTTNAFYVAISCKFSNWTIMSIYNFIKVCPLFYQNDIRSFIEQIKPHFDKSIQTLKRFVDTNVERFIRLLNKFIDADSKASYYKDTSILKALITFKLKMHFISLENEAQQTENEISDVEKIRLILEEMTVLQKVLSMNCADLPNGNKYPQVYGYWIPTYHVQGTGKVDNVKISVGDNDTIFKEIEVFFVEFYQTTKLVSFNYPYCEVKYMFLENIVAINLNDQISIDISNAVVKTTDTETMLIKDFLQLAKVSYDVDIILLYQNAVLTTIIKLIFSKVIEIMVKQESLSVEIINTIKTLQNDLPNLSSDFIQGLKLIAKLNDSDSSITMQDIKYFYSSMENIEFKEFNLTPSSIYNNPTDYLNHLMERLNNNYNDLRYYNSQFMYLNYVHDKYYTPSVKSKISLLSTDITKNLEQTNENCNLVLKMYTACFEAIRFLKKFDSESNYSAVAFKLRCFERSKKLLWVINNSIFDMIERNEKDSEILNMTYNIAIILANTRVETNNHMRSYTLHRVFNMVLTELNSYALKYCKPPNFNFLLFNNIAFNTIGMDDSMPKPAKIISKDKTSVENYEFMSAKYLFKTFIENSKVFNYYEEVIKFYWKGKLETVHEIYNDAIVFTLNSRQLYALYDIYFKFYIAAIYFEINSIILKNSDGKIKNKKLSKIKKIWKNVLPTFFPREMESLITDITTLLYSSLMETDTIQTKIDENFKEFNIVIGSAPNLTKKLIGKLTFSVYSNLDNEINSVKIVYDKFLQFIRQPVKQNQP